MDSGTAWLPTFSKDKARANFTFVAESLGCKNSTGIAELDCVRGIPSERIESFLKGYQDNGTTPLISFLPVQDNITFFTDPGARAKEVKLSKVRDQNNDYVHFRGLTNFRCHLACHHWRRCK